MTNNQDETRTPGLCRREVAERLGTPGLRRREVAERLGVSVSSVRRLEWSELKPELDTNGVWRFDPSEVERVALVQGTTGRARPVPLRDDVLARSVARRGRLAARVFRMFGRSLSLPQIVVATKQPPHVIRELYREWCTSLQEAQWADRQAP